MKKNIDKKPTNWAKKNEWFGSDRKKTCYAFEIHNLLINNEIDPETKSYYKIIDGFMSHYDETKKMKLTPVQLAIAKRLGVPLKEYMKGLR